jgi:hypothetical protein
MPKSIKAGSTHRLMWDASKDVNGGSWKTYKSYRDIHRKMRKKHGPTHPKTNAAYLRRQEAGYQYSMKALDRLGKVFKKGKKAK